MQTVNAALQAELAKGQTEPIVLVDLFEFYDYDYLPGVSGFDPTDAIEKFAAQEITWNGIAYRRELISRGDISKNMGEKTNSVELTFSNISRYMATLAQSQQIEGLFLVIRCVAPSVTTDSLVLFVGRCDKPSDIDKKTFSLSARQDFGNINVTLPPSKFEADDPEGRLPSDPLFEGIPFTAVGGSNQFPEIVPTDSRIGRLLGRKRVIWHTRQWSSVDNTAYGSPIPECFGRVQMELIPFRYADKGTHVGYLMAACRGPVDAISFIKSRTQGMSDPICSFANPPAPAVIHLGDLGGTGTNNGNTCQADLAGGLFFSHLAYIEGASAGVENGAIVPLGIDVEDAVPTITAIVRGKKITCPNSSGVFSVTKWSDNPICIARHILTDPSWVNIDPAFMEDSVLYQTYLHCDFPLVDESSTEVIVIASADLPRAGIDFTRFRSTGLYTPRWFRFNHLGDLSLVPELEDGPYIGVGLGDTVPDPADTTDPSFLTQKPLRKRYTANFPITEEVRAVDLLHKTLFPAAKLFMRVNKHGRYEIRPEKSSDSTRLRTATTVDATLIPLLDVTPWKTGPDLLLGRILLGFGLTTSEVRTPTAAEFSPSGNSITLTASSSGGVTATASGVALTGGSTTVQASGTVTIGGTPAAGNTITATINGIAVTYILNADDTTGTAAGMLAHYINANQRLNKYVKTEWSSGTPTVITIKCLHGALTVPALLKTHGIGIADPVTAPTVAASGGTLLAGTYKVAYSDITANGSTALTNEASIVLAASQKIDVSSLPALVGTARDFYVSEKANSTNLRFHTRRTDASNFSLNSLPLAGAAVPPSSNTTAEELIRIAKSFATNSQDVFPAWTPSTAVALNDVYLPTVLNDHKYQVTTQGITGVAEPTWPTTAGGTVASGTAVFTEIGETVLGQAGLTRANVIKDSFKWPLGSRQSTVNQIKGNFRSATNDFALTPFRITDRDHVDQVKKIFPMDVDLSAVDNENQMERIGNFLLSKFREGDHFHSLGAGPDALVLEEGDVICASDDSGGLINVVTRIEDLRIRPNHDVFINQARKYSTQMFSDDVGAHRIPIPSTLKFTQTKDTDALLVDNYAIRDADALTPGFYWIPSHDLSVEGDWRGATLFADYGDGYKPIAESDLAAFVGTCTTTLGAVANPSMWDMTNTVTFAWNFGDGSSTLPTTVTQTQLADNSRRNLFLIGNEYVQAATITNNGNGTYTLSVLLRGRFGTDNSQFISHSASERIAFLNGAEQFVAIDPVRLNGAFNYKSVTVNQNISDATADSFTWTGGTVRPLSPSGVVGSRNASGDLLIDWSRRSRLAPGLRPLSDVPLGEEAERYEVEIYSGSTLKRMIKVEGNAIQPIIWQELKNDVDTVTTTSVGTITIAGPGAGSAFTEARSAQFWLGDEAFLEFTVDGTERIPNVGFTSLFSPFGNPDFAYAFGGSTATDVAAADNTGLIGSTTVVAGDRLGIRVRVGVVEFFKNYAGEMSVPLTRSSITWPTGRKMQAFCSKLTGDTVKALTVRGLIDVSRCLYSAADQVEDFGSTQSSVKVRVYQVSAIVGRGPYTEATI